MHTLICQSRHQSYKSQPRPRPIEDYRVQQPGPDKTTPDLRADLSEMIRQGQIKASPRELTQQKLRNEKVTAKYEQQRKLTAINKPFEQQLIKSIISTGNILGGNRDSLRGVTERNEGGAFRLPVLNKQADIPYYL